MTDISHIVKTHLPDLGPYEDIYKHIHAHPELSRCERETAALVARTLAKLADVSITTGIGGHGLAAVLANGAGPTVLLRADMDALPVREMTGLPYASQVTAADADGEMHPVMHACGHDMHVSALLGAAALLHAARSTWQGTLVLVFQPAEEKGVGAKAMVDDGLYARHRVPVPDVAIGAHVAPNAAGQVGLRAGRFLSAADSFRVVFHGRGAHGSSPNLALDPVVSAAYATIRLQALVSREANPQDPTVVTVGCINAGRAENVIPDSAEMKVDIRSPGGEARDHLVAGVRRVVEAEAQAAGMPPPTIERLRSFPPLVNDPEATRVLSAAMGRHFKESWSDSYPIQNASEDFPILATAVDRPGVFFMYGGADPETWQRMRSEGREKEMPINHSPRFAPVIQPTLRMGVEGYAVAALAWLAGGAAAAAVEANGAGEAAAR